MEKILKSIILTAIVLLLSNIVSQAQADSITGFLKYHGTWGMENSTIFLHDETGNTIASATTNSQGHFVFQSVSAGTYTLTATTDLDPGGIDLADSYLILKYLFGLYTFTPIQFLAADVNGSGTVTWADYWTIVTGWFTYGYPFPVGDWVFEEETVTSGSRDNVTISGSSSGDVTGNFQPEKNFWLAISSTDDHETPIELGTNSIPIKITAQENISGFYLKLNIPDDIDISGIESDLGDLVYNIADNTLVLLWTSQDPEEYLSARSTFTIKVISQISRVPANELSVMIDGSSHFINDKGELTSQVSLILPKPVFKIANQAIDSQEVTVYPNPCTNLININFTASGSNMAELILIDMTGRIVKTSSHTVLNDGVNSMPIDMTNLNPGTYHYRLLLNSSTGMVTHSGSMIKK